MQLYAFTLLLVFTTRCVHAQLPAGSILAGLKRSGNILVNAAGTTIHLQGVDRSGTEYACIQGLGFQDGPIDTASLTAIKSWNVNMVRVPLNEGCWLNLAPVTAVFGGTNYITYIQGLVNSILAQDMVVALDLRWSSGAGNTPATGPQPMPNTQNSIPFWTSVATTFSNVDGVIYDLFNEPAPNNNTLSVNDQLSWACWLSGGAACTGLGFEVAGMQTLVTTVRNTGANNIIMLGGCSFANDVSLLLNKLPTDPAKNLVASIHTYNTNFCSTLACWQQYYAPVAAVMPVIAGAVGEKDNTGTFVSTILPWFKSVGIHPVASEWSLVSKPSLISNFDGTTSAVYGAAVKTLFVSTAISVTCPALVPIGASCMASPNCCPGSAPTCFQKDAFFATCASSCVPGIHANDPVQFQTIWSCAVLGTSSAAVNAMATPAPAISTMTVIEASVSIAVVITVLVAGSIFYVVRNRKNKSTVGKDVTAKSSSSRV